MCTPSLLHYNFTYYWWENPFRLGSSCVVLPPHLVSSLFLPFDISNIMLPLGYNVALGCESYLISCFSHLLNSGCHSFAADRAHRSQDQVCERSRSRIIQICTITYLLLLSTLADASQNNVLQHLSEVRRCGSPKQTHLVYKRSDAEKKDGSPPREVVVWVQGVVGYVHLPPVNRYVLYTPSYDMKLTQSQHS